MTPIRISRKVSQLTDADLAHTKFHPGWHYNRNRLTAVQIKNGALVYLVPARLWVPHACSRSATALPAPRRQRA